MKDQIRHAACSMSDNIAEGFEYNNNPDFIRYLNYAKGSSGEFRNKLYILSQSGKLDKVVYERYMQEALNFRRRRNH